MKKAKQAAQPRWRKSKIAALFVISCLLLLATGLKLRYGGGADFPDRSGTPLWSEERLEVVADLPYPPGNIAVSEAGQVFFTYHPEARPPQNLMLLGENGPQPWPNAEMQPGGSHPQALHEVLSIRIDRQGRLWALDNGTHGIKPARMLAFDLDSGDIVHSHTFSRDVAGIGSHFNDFQVSPDGEHIYIADASFFALKPAVLHYAVKAKKARIRIAEHESVVAEHYVPTVQGRRMEAFGLVAIRPGVDSIALTEDGNWLYFAPISNNYMYRIATTHLRNAELSAEQVQRKVQRVALKTMSDGISMDSQNNIYISDLEHSAIVRMNAQGEMQTLLKDKRLRWPDGFSFGPDDELYVTASSLHQIIGKPPSAVSSHAPYQIFKLHTGVHGHAGR